MKGAGTFLSMGERPIQEDHVLVKEDRGLILVADGFGGSLSGLETARLANDSIVHFVGRQSQDEEATMPFELRGHLTWDANILGNAVLHANREILKWNQKRSAQARGGASVVAARVRQKHLCVCSVGNASSWLLREGESKALTHPKSLGLFEDPFMGWGKPGRQIPLLSLGTHERLEPEILEVRIEEGDWLVLHSDGVWPDVIEELGRLQRKNLEFEASLRSFEEICKLTSFNDNASISLAIF